MKKQETNLDNPIWQALSTQHATFNEGDERLKYFFPEVSPFVAMADWKLEDQAYLEMHLPAERGFFYIIRDKIQLPDSCRKVFTIPLWQMVMQQHIPFSAKGINIQPLDHTHIPAMIALTALTRPGPFTQRTIEFGNYMGIFEKDQLVAMAGERLKVPGYTEVSAICTHPEATGKGYGAALLSAACTRIIENGQIPFLHVRNDNLRAIKMYERAGFAIRCEMDFAIFKKTSLPSEQ